MVGSSWLARPGNVVAIRHFHGVCLSARHCRRRSEARLDVTVIPINATQGWTLGGSEAAAACGVDPYRSRVALWLEKRGELRNDAGEPALWGTLLEPVVYGELERRGYNVMPGFVDGIQDDDKPWLV